MVKLDYVPSLAGKGVYKNGKLIKVRKYHLEPKEMITRKREFKKDIKDVPALTRNKVKGSFFNPYTRRGIYYYQIQTLYLLGAGSYHSFLSILRKIKDIMPQWDKFKHKERRNNTYTHKGYIKRIEENFFFFQRISGLNPYGYKLRQASAALDIKLQTHKELGKEFLYRLSSYHDFDKALPIRDLSGYRGSDSGKFKVRFSGKLVME